MTQVLAAFVFSTARLQVKPWHDFPEVDTAAFVTRLMTPAVTKTLPPHWQGTFDLDRAKQWIVEQDAQGSSSLTLMAVETDTLQPVGLMMLFLGEDEPGTLRVGYMLAEAFWGKGFGTEIVSGLVNWSKRIVADENLGLGKELQCLKGGVGHDNPASAHILRKCGFREAEGEGGADETMFEIVLREQASK